LVLGLFGTPMVHFAVGAALAAHGFTLCG